jgi:hypothetical protein
MKQKPTPGKWYATQADDPRPETFEDGDTPGGYTMTADDHYSPEHFRERAWTISTDPRYAGWNTDSGYQDRGLRKPDALIMAQAKELLECLEEVVRISDRKHDAWDRAKAVMAAARGEHQT